MKAFDKIPATAYDQPFPMGDITEPDKLEKARQWFNDIHDLDSAKFTSYIRGAYVPTDKDHIHSRLTNQMALIVTQYWGTTHTSRHDLVTKGYMTACTFMRETKFLPDFDMDFRKSLSYMRTEVRPEVFAENAWSGMARSHPNVFKQYEKLYELGAEHFELELVESSSHFIAGLSLAYMLSAAAWLEKDVKISRFTSMVNSQETKYDLRTTDFADLFAPEPGLTTNNITKRKMNLS